MSAILIKKTFHLLFFCILFSIFSYSFAQNAQAIDIKKYLFPPGSSGTSMSTGEFFKVIDEGNGYYKILKSRDSKYYERYRVVGDKVYHVEDTTWATEEGDVKCIDSGNDAAITYEGGQLEWAPTSMSTGQNYETKGGRIIGRDKVTGKDCQTRYSGQVNNRKIELIHQGCITFPNGVTSDDAVAMRITEGLGAGETFYYDSGRGWIGFSREDGVDGAYVTDPISSKTHAPGECLLAQMSNVRKTCPAGFTCPKNSKSPTLGEKISISKLLGYGASVIDALKGITGPKDGILITPKLSQENNFYSTQDFFDRTLTDSQQKEFKIEEKVFLEGKIAHPGCGRIVANGGDAGLTETNPETLEFQTSRDYNRLLLTNEYWRCILVNGFNCNLKFTNVQTDYGEPSKNSGECQDNDGQSADKTDLLIEPAQNLEIASSSVISFLRGLVSNLKCIISEFTGETKCGQVKVDFALQQQKFIPNEETFDNQTVNKDGFLNFFKAGDLSYEKANSERDQDEKSQYVVLGSTREINSSEEVGTTFKGVADFQKETVNLVKSLYVEDIAKDINSLDNLGQSTNTSTTVSSGDISHLLKIPYRDSSIQVTAEMKTRIIKKVTGFFSDSPIGEHWDTVVARARSAGINPAFALALWIEESGASSTRIGSYSGWGCNPSKKQTISESLDCFIKTTINSPSTPDFAKWAGNYCGTPAPGFQVCTMNAAGHNNKNFLVNLNSWYNEFGVAKLKGVD